MQAADYALTAADGARFLNSLYFGIDENLDGQLDSASFVYDTVRLVME